MILLFVVFFDDKEQKIQKAKNSGRKHTTLKECINFLFIMREKMFYFFLMHSETYQKHCRNGSYNEMGWNVVGFQAENLVYRF